MKKIIPLIVCTFLFSLISVALSEKNEYLGDKHEKKFGVGCDGCHDENPPSKNVGTKKCISCHGKPEEFGKNPKQTDYPNPHINHNDELYCEDCHHSHKTPEIYCNQCHSFNYIVP